MHVAKATAAGLLMLIALVLSAGCTVRQDIVLRADGSGQAGLQVELHPILIRYVNDLASAMTGRDVEHPVFDEAQIAAVIRERQGIDLVRLEQRGRGGLVVDVAFRDISELFAREGASDVLWIEPRGANRELIIRLNREAVYRFLDFAPADSAAMMQMLFPPADGSVTRNAYRDELAWALEEYERRSVVERVLDEARIDVRVVPAGRIVSQQGGRIVGDAVVFSVPVLELLTLAEERRYSVVFAP